MKDKDEAPPSFDELEPEGDYSSLTATAPAPSQQDRADRIPLEAIEEDYLDDADWFEGDAPSKREAYLRRSRAHRAGPKAGRTSTAQPSPERDWDEEFDAELEADDASDEVFYEDDFEDFEDETFDMRQLEDELLEAAFFGDDADSPEFHTALPPGFSRPKRDRRAAGLREDERLLKTLAKRAGQTGSGLERAALIGSLVPLALKAHPQVYGALTPLIPSLIQAMLKRRTHSRELLGLLQTVVHGLAAKAARGEALTASHVTKLIAAHTRRPALASSRRP